jgi:hypothetical protein
MLLDDGHDVVHVVVEVDQGDFGRLRPEVVAQVEGVALPAAAREVRQVALPDPRPGQLAVDEQQRPASRTPLRHPRLHVEPAFGDFNLVLADRAAVGADRMRSGDVQLVGDVVAHLLSVTTHGD